MVLSSGFQPCLPHAPLSPFVRMSNIFYLKSMGAGKAGQSGALAPPRISKLLLLLLFIGVICITCEG